MCPETFTEEELTETRLCGIRGQDGDREAELPQKLQKRWLPLQGTLIPQRKNQSTKQAPPFYNSVVTFVCSEASTEHDL